MAGRVMGGSSTGDMPNLDAFDQEFGRQPVAVLRAQQRRTALRPLAGLLLAVAIISVPTLAWLSADGRPMSDGQSRPMALQSAGGEGSQEQVERLLRQVAALKQEINELTQAEQEARESIAALKAAEQEARTPAPAYWYSDPAALNFGTVGPPSTVAAAPPRRAATARPETREPRRRDTSAPLSLEAPQ
jgi:hypothetical protein